MIDPVSKTVTVPLSPAEAFKLFVTDMTQWWPVAGYSVSGDTAQIMVECYKGGRIVEKAADGSEHVWGTIIGWEEGRFAAFTWHPGRDPDDATVVAVSFKSSGDGCLVDLTHGGFDILGDTADAVSQSYLTGWDMVLGCYCAAATKLRVFA